MRIIFTFLDGVGLGGDDPARNAFAAADLPVLHELLGGVRPLRAQAPVRGRAATLLGLDATLGVSGTPQSGTGQTALLTGRNAAAAFGRHFGPWVPATLRPLLRADNVLARAQRAGFDVAFANAYPEELFEPRAADRPGLREDVPRAIPGAGTALGTQRGAPRYLHSGPPLAALSAGVLTRHTAALERGEALASEITNDGWRERLGRSSLPAITAAEAGRNLARIGAAHDLTLFAHYSTDYAGHTGRLDRAIEAVRRVDEFLGGLVTAMPADCLLVVASDHGNVEDASAGHTRNPALALVVGEGHAESTAGWTAITDVAPAIMDVLAR